MTNNMRTRDIRRMILIGLIVALVSQLYWNIFINNFRISSSRDHTARSPDDAWKKSFHTAHLRCDRSHRVLLPPVSGAPQRDQSPRLSESVFPNAIFYFCYGIIFAAMVPENIPSPTAACFRPFFADFGSNLVELLHFREYVTLHDSGQGRISLPDRTVPYLSYRSDPDGGRSLPDTLKTKSTRTVTAVFFLMTTGLKNEIYFMRKILKRSNPLWQTHINCMKLNEMDVPEDMKHMSLAIARDVHEIKKDYIRIIQGIEEEISEEYDEKQMSFQDILKILKTQLTIFWKIRMSIFSWNSSVPIIL